MNGLGTNGVLAVLAAGAGLQLMCNDKLEEEEATVQNVVVQLVQLPAFVLVGLLLPLERWAEWGWAGAFFVALLFLLRRPPALLLLAPLLKKTGGLAAGRLGWGEAIFAGWFGPVGIAAVYYATLADRRLGLTFNWEVVSLAVAASVVVHGVTAYPLTRLMGRYEPQSSSSSGSSSADESSSPSGP